jgi:protein-S-isoprenylcysteine O-methyltransferase Ste14
MEVAARVLLALMYAVFLYGFLRNFVEHHRLSSLLFSLVETVFLYMAITRRSPVEVSSSGVAWLLAFVGTLGPLLLQPSASVDSAVGQAIQVAGIALTGLSIGSLGRSFGLVAANRGIVSSGMYRYVRHPLYMAYFVNIAGFLVNHASAYNLVLVAVLAFAQLGRIQYEEKLLRKDPLYARYADTVRWRLIPYLF